MPWRRHLLLLLMLLMLLPSASLGGAATTRPPATRAEPGAAPDRVSQVTVEHRRFFRHSASHRWYRRYPGWVILPNDFVVSRRWWLHIRDRQGVNELIQTLVRHRSAKLVRLARNPKKFLVILKYLGFWTPHYRWLTRNELVKHFVFTLLRVPARIFSKFARNRNFYSTKVWRDVWSWSRAQYEHHLRVWLLHLMRRLKGPRRPSRADHRYRRWHRQYADRGHGGPDRR